MKIGEQWIKKFSWKIQKETFEKSDENVLQTSEKNRWNFDFSIVVTKKKPKNWLEIRDKSIDNFQKISEFWKKMFFSKKNHEKFF